jgi:hypothetical protein
MKQPHERGGLGAWLVEQRKRLSEERRTRLTQKMVTTEIAEMGYPIEESYYRALESGSKKSAGLELREAFARYYGRTPPSPSAGRSGSDMELAAAVREQTAAIKELVATLRGQSALDPQALAAAVGAALAMHLRPPPDEVAADQQTGTTQ